MLIPAQPCGHGFIIPYTADLVPIYHSWFQSFPELLALTATDPLSLSEETDNQRSWESGTEKLTGIICDQDSKPVGDVNVFWDAEELTGELNVMIADPAARRQGLARAAVEVAMGVSRDKFPGLKKFLAKIDLGNEKSINLFLSLGFKEIRRVAVFNEVHLEKD